MILVFCIEGDSWSGNNNEYLFGPEKTGWAPRREGDGLIVWREVVYLFEFNGVINEAGKIQHSEGIRQSGKYDSGV